VSSAGKEGFQPELLGGHVDRGADGGHDREEGEDGTVEVEPEVDDRHRGRAEVWRRDQVGDVGP
jgi:hypothetical protein